MYAEAWRPVQKRLSCALIACSLCAPWAMAESAQVTEFDTPTDVEVLLGTPVANAELELLRGKFSTADGLEFAFSFESVTRVNGDILSQASVVVPVLSLISNPTEAMGNQVLSATLQNALSGQSVSNAAQLGLIFEPVILQNALDNQVIETLSVLNLEVFGSNNLNAPAVRSAILSTMVAALKQ